MFTGIITNLGKVKKIENKTFQISTDKGFLEKIDNGVSIAVNGACLTVKQIPKQNTFLVEVIPETLRKTMLGSLKTNDLVNLELPMTTDKFFAGHIVQGHVDGVAEITNVKEEANSRIFRFKLAEKLTRYIVDKGSIAVNGSSLTVIETGKNWFSVGITPYTWRHTMLHQAKEGDIVNIELDIIAKYIEKLSKQDG